MSSFSRRSSSHRRRRPSPASLAGVAVLADALPPLRTSCVGAAAAGRRPGAPPRRRGAATPPRLCSSSRSPSASVVRGASMTAPICAGLDCAPPRREGAATSADRAPAPRRACADIVDGQARRRACRAALGGGGRDAARHRRSRSVEQPSSCRATCAWRSGAGRWRRARAPNRTQLPGSLGPGFIDVAGGAAIGDAEKMTTSADPCRSSVTVGFDALRRCCVIASSGVWCAVCRARRKDDVSGRPARGVHRGAFAPALGGEAARRIVSQNQLRIRGHSPTRAARKIRPGGERGRRRAARTGFDAAAVRGADAARWRTPPAVGIATRRAAALPSPCRQLRRRNGATPAWRRCWREGSAAALGAAAPSRLLRRRRRLDCSRASHPSPALRVSDVAPAARTSTSARAEFRTPPSIRHRACAGRTSPSAPRRARQRARRTPRARFHHPARSKIRKRPPGAPLAGASGRRRLAIRSNAPRALAHSRLNSGAGGGEPAANRGGGVGLCSWPRWRRRSRGVGMSTAAGARRRRRTAWRRARRGSSCAP